MEAAQVNQSTDRQKGSPTLVEILPLTGIRGIAAIAVLVYHALPYWFTLFPGLQVIEPLADKGYIGVDLFFFLSGFIICYAYHAGRRKFGLSEYRDFIGMRFARIYPNHFVTLALLVAMVSVAKLAHWKIDYENYPWEGLPSQLLMVHIWPGLYSGRWNLPAWSISAEWFAYLVVFPIAVRLLRRDFTTVQSLLLSFLIFVTSAAICYLWIPHAPSMPRAILTVSSEFLVGSLFYGIYRSGSALTGYLQRWASAIFLLFLIVIAFVPPSFWVTMAAIGLLPLLILGLTSQTSLFGKVLSISPILWLGHISYALYMSHFFTLQILRKFMNPQNFVTSSWEVRAAILAVHLAMVFAFAAALYYIVEKPCREHIRRFLKRKPASLPQSVAVST